MIVRRAAGTVRIGQGDPAPPPRHGGRRPRDLPDNLGTGNHFIEICLDEAGFVWFMLHSGSSGAGNVIGTMFIGLAKQDAMRQNARLRDRALACLEKGSRCFSEDLDVTRQGALSARAGQLGIVPRSMGARSCIARGQGHPDSFERFSHGASRAMSRGEARRRFTLADHRAATAGVNAARTRTCSTRRPRPARPSTPSWPRSATSSRCQGLSGLARGAGPQACERIHARTTSAITSSGTEPARSTTSWKAGRLNLGPSAARASSRRARMRSCPTM